jgi:hypothetical protein
MVFTHKHFVKLSKTAPGPKQAALKFILKALGVEERQGQKLIERPNHTA